MGTEHWWNDDGTMKVPESKPVPLPLFPPYITHVIKPEHPC